MMPSLTQTMTNPEAATAQRRARTPFPGGWRICLVCLALLASAAAGLWHASVPRPATPDAAPTAFSAARALLKLRHIAPESHPIGTAANTQVRDYLVRELTSLGLAPQVQQGAAVSPVGRGDTVGYVHNIVARVPGRASGKALLLVAHYDSAPTGPGAADDGASVAAILETLRAIKAGGTLQNDVICLFTDGEEAGLLGAQAFVDKHPWVKDVGMVLNFDYRGNSGPMLLFETSVGNSALVDGFKRVPLPLGNSFFYEIYKHLPNDTDMTVFKHAGMTGLNFAAIEGLTNYHTRLDRVDALNQGTLQHQGDTMLALVRQFGNASLDNLRSTDSVFFDLPGGALVSYGPAWIWPLNLLAIGLFTAVAVTGGKRGLVRFTRIALAAAGLVLLVVVMAVGSQLLWTGVGALHPDFRQMLGGTPYHDQWYLPGFAALVAALFFLAQRRLTAQLRPLESALGSVLVWLVLLCAVSAVLPGASFLFAWPMIAASSCLLVFVARSEQAQDQNRAAHAGWMPLLCAVLPAVILFSPFIWQVYVALTPQMMGVVMAVLVLLLGALLPLLVVFGWRRRVSAVLLVGGALLLVVAHVNSTFDDSRPRPDHLQYVQDGATGKAYWLSQDRELDAWTKTFFPDARERRRLPEVFGERLKLLWAAPAPALALPVPQIEVRQDRVSNGERSLVLGFRSGRGASTLSIGVEGADVLRSEFAQQVFTSKQQAGWWMQAHGVPEQGGEVRIVVKSGVPFRVRLTDSSVGLPLSQAQARPAAMMARVTEASDELQVVGVTEFK